MSDRKLRELQRKALSGDDYDKQAARAEKRRQTEKINWRDLIIKWVYDNSLPKTELNPVDQIMTTLLDSSGSMPNYDPFKATRERASYVDRSINNWREKQK